MGGKKGDGGMGHPKIPDFQDLNSHSKGAHQETSKREAHEERVHSNATASTSLRCGFSGLELFWTHVSIIGWMTMALQLKILTLLIII